MLSYSSHIPILGIINWHLYEVWDYFNGHNCGLCGKTVGGRLGKDLVNKNCLKNQQLTHLWTLSLLKRTGLCVIPDDNYAQKQGVGDWARIRWVNNKCLNNQKLTPLWNLRLFQRTELWVVPDDNSAWKQGVEDRGSIWFIITVSTISHWHLCDVWAYTNGQNFVLCLMIIMHKIRECDIGQDFVGRLIMTVSTISNRHLS